jgi:hypothetical protein
MSARHDHKQRLPPGGPDSGPVRWRGGGCLRGTVFHSSISRCRGVRDGSHCLYGKTSIGKCKVEHSKQSQSVSLQERTCTYLIVPKRRY